MPGFTKRNQTYRSLRHAEIEGNHALKITLSQTLFNLRNRFVIKFCAWMFLTVKSVLEAAPLFSENRFSVVKVFSLGAVFQIYEAVVGFNTVDMVCHVPRWWLTNKSQQHQLMNTPISYDALAISQVNVSVVARVIKRFKKTWYFLPVAQYVPEITYLIQSFIARNITPALIVCDKIVDSHFSPLLTESVRLGAGRLHALRRFAYFLDYNANHEK